MLQNLSSATVVIDALRVNSEFMIMFIQGPLSSMKMGDNNACTFVMTGKNDWSISSDDKYKMSRGTWFPTMWQFDMCRLRRARAASCQA